MRAKQQLLLASIATACAVTALDAAAAPPATLDQMWAIIQQQQKEIETLKKKTELADVQGQELKQLRAETEVLKKERGTASGGNDAQRKTDILASEVEKLKTALVIPESKQYKSQYGLGPAASGVYGVNKGLSIGGYGEAVYTNQASDKGAKKDTIDAERLVMYLGYKFSDRIILNNEIEFEHASTGEGAEQKGEVSVEFSQLDFLLHPAANIRAGLMLMPMGFINEMHEPTTFHGNYRPEVERRIIQHLARNGRRPVRRTLARPAIPPVRGQRPGRQRLLLRRLERGDARRQHGQGGKLRHCSRVDYSPSFVPGLMVGGSAYMGDSGQSQKFDGLKKNAFTQLYEGHLQWHYKGFEFRSLGAWGRVNNAAALSAAKGETIGSATFGWYTEGAYDVMPHLMPTSNQYLAPFVRYERFDTIADVPTGYADDPAQNKEVYQAGVTYKPIGNVAIKADYRNISARKANRRTSSTWAWALSSNRPMTTPCAEP